MDGTSAALAELPVDKITRVEVERDTQLVEFVFKVPIGLPSYITLSAFGVGLVLIGVLAVAGRRKGTSVSRK